MGVERNDGMSRMGKGKKCSGVRMNRLRMEQRAEKDIERKKKNIRKPCGCLSSPTTGVDNGEHDYGDINEDRKEAHKATSESPRQCVHVKFLPSCFLRFFIFTLDIHASDFHKTGDPPNEREEKANEEAPCMKRETRLLITLASHLHPLTPHHQKRIRTSGFLGAGG